MSTRTLRLTGEQLATNHMVAFGRLAPPRGTRQRTTESCAILGEQDKTKDAGGGAPQVITNGALFMIGPTRELVLEFQSGREGCRLENRGKISFLQAKECEKQVTRAESTKGKLWRHARSPNRAGLRSGIRSKAIKWEKLEGPPLGVISLSLTYCGCVVAELGRSNR